MKHTFYNAVGIAELMMKDGYEIIRLEWLHRGSWSECWQIVGVKGHLELYMNTGITDWDDVKRSLADWKRRE